MILSVKVMKLQSVLRRDENSWLFENFPLAGLHQSFSLTFESGKDNNVGDIFLKNIEPPLRRGIFKLPICKKISRPFLCGKWRWVLEEGMRSILLAQKKVLHFLQLCRLRDQTKNDRKLKFGTHTPREHI